MPTSDIRIIREPEIYVLGRQTVSDAELNRFLSDHGVSWETDTEIAAEELCETAGRVCYMSFAKPRPGGNATYLGHIKESGHGSVLEHAVWNLLITGVSRTLTHELIRHRAGMAFSQLSQRYVDESVAEYIEPDLHRRRSRIAFAVPGRRRPCPPGLCSPVRTADRTAQGRTRPHRPPQSSPGRRPAASCRTRRRRRFSSPRTPAISATSSSSADRGSRSRKSASWPTKCSTCCSGKRRICSAIISARRCPTVHGIDNGVSQSLSGFGDFDALAP